MAKKKPIEHDPNQLEMFPRIDIAPPPPPPPPPPVMTFQFEAQWQAKAFAAAINRRYGGGNSGLNARVFNDTRVHDFIVCLFLPVHYLTYHIEKLAKKFGGTQILEDDERHKTVQRIFGELDDTWWLKRMWIREQQKLLDEKKVAVGEK